MIYELKGNLLESECMYICHQVNCQGKMNSGVAKAIRDKWPEVYTKYLEKYIKADGHSDELLGEIQHVPVSNLKVVVNMFAQEYYGYDGKHYTSYDAFWSCLNYLTITIPKGSGIAFPGYIGCARGGANWDVIKNMIEVVLGKDYEVTIYYLEEEKNEKG